MSEAPCTAREAEGEWNRNYAERGTALPTLMTLTRLQTVIGSPPPRRHPQHSPLGWRSPHNKPPLKITASGLLKVRAIPFSGVLGIFSWKLLKYSDFIGQHCFHYSWIITKGMNLIYVTWFSACKALLKTPARNFFIVGNIVQNPFKQHLHFWLRRLWNIKTIKLYLFIENMTIRYYIKHGKNRKYFVSLIAFPWILTTKVIRTKTNCEKVRDKLSWC